MFRSVAVGLLVSIVLWGAACDVCHAATSSSSSSSSVPVEGSCDNDPASRTTSGRALVHGEWVSIEEPRFSKHVGRYPPPSATTPNQSQTPTPTQMSYYLLNDEKPVLYVPNFLNATTMRSLKDFCVLQEGRFTQSPIGGYEGRQQQRQRQRRGDDEQDGEHGKGSSTTTSTSTSASTSSSATTTSDLRTSESCTLVPASVYLNHPQFQQLLQQDPLPDQIAKIAQEVDVSWEIAVRAANLLGQTPQQVEALQLVRYTSPDAAYQLHHDHGGYYGKSTEHRPWTMLIFLNDLHDDEGGETAFPELGLEVQPKGGDALVWSNTLRDTSTSTTTTTTSTSNTAYHDNGSGNENDNGGQSSSSSHVVDPDMVHMGKPPTKEGTEKYAVNVWFGVSTLEDRAAQEGGQR